MATRPLSSLIAEANDDPVSREMFEHQAGMVVRGNTPATEGEVGKVIFGLLIMYPEFDRRGEASKSMVVDQWRKSLAGWPVDVLEKATQEWINSPKGAFMPQPGNVLETCERIGAFGRAMAKKADELLKMINATKGEG